MKLQSAYAQVSPSGCERSWLASMHAGVALAHQPQPNWELQSPQLALGLAQTPGQLPRHVEKSLPEHELSAEPSVPTDSHLPLLAQ